jgi:hypothetical protein
MSERLIHPSRRAYSKGCRCDLCVQLHTEELREGIERRRKEFEAGEREITHGIISGRKLYGCKCEPCMAIYRKQMANSNANRAVRYAKNFASRQKLKRKRIDGGGNDWTVS